MTARPSVVRLDRVPMSGNGVAWSASPEGVHMNLVGLEPGGAIAEHRNDALDVIVVVMDGTLVATVDGGDVEVPAAGAVVIPRGSRRALTAGVAGARYLTVHASRPPMEIGPRPDV